MLLEEGNISKPEISNEDSSNRKRSSSLTEQVIKFPLITIFCLHIIYFLIKPHYLLFSVCREAGHEDSLEKIERWI